MIYLIIGKSGVGKSSIVNGLKNNKQVKPKINIIKSYTTRKQRDIEDTDHTFISKKDIKKYEDDIVASSWINDEFYFATNQQFKENYANVYIVDLKGLEDILKMFNNKKIVIVEIKSSNKYIEDDKRLNRNINSIYENANAIIYNDGKLTDAIDEMVEIVNMFYHYWED